MKVYITKLRQVFVTDEHGRSRTVVLRPGDRVDGLRDAGPAGLIPVQEVSNLKHILGPVYDELVQDGTIQE